MLNEVAKKWVEALRSGKYEQGTGCLREGDKFCCLGVLVDLYHKEHPGKLSKGDWEEHGVVYISDPSGYEEDGSELVKTIQEWVGLRKPYGCRGYGADIDLTHLNDKDGYTFNQIADVIEDRADDLFVS